MKKIDVDILKEELNNLDNTQYVENKDTTEKLKCLICGKEFNSRLSPHIISKHNMSTQEYKSLFGKDVKITSDNFIKRKANLSRGRKQSQETRTKISKSKKGTTAWNKGLTRETDLRVEKYSKSKEGKKRTLEQRIRISERTKEGMNNPIVKSKISKANRSRVYTKEQKEKRSLISRNLWKNPNYANKCSNPRYGNKPVYNGTRFMSDTEMLFAKKLDELNIKYKYQAGPFKYLKRRDNKYHNYYPDFYLLEYDLYLEIKYRKNYLYGLDDVLEDKLEGMKQLNLKCIILDRRDLKDLDIIILNIA